MRGLTMHEQFLLAALEQAWLGRGTCAPNPSVGAVAVLNGKIIAQSWHRGAGTPHAEKLLLEQLPNDCSNVILYVTLEPCNHWGRTAPCVEAIIERGIKQVVYGYTDPNPVVSSNNTPMILKQHHIQAKFHPLPEIDAFYQSYSYWTRTKKPWVTVKMAQTFDGKIAGPAGERVMLSNDLCAQFTHEQRKCSDVILTTARTVNNDDPMLNVRLPEGTCSKPIAIIDTRLELNQHAKLLNHVKPCHIYHAVADVTSFNRDIFSLHAMPASSGQLDLNAVITHLGQLGYHDVWIEAGATLFNALHQAGLVNRTYLYLVPKFLGEKATSLYSNACLFDNMTKITWIPKEDNLIVQCDHIQYRAHS